MIIESWMLNPRIVAKQKLTEAEITEIVDLHNVRESVFDTMKSLTPNVDRGKLSICVAQVEHLEFALQKAWRFVQTKSMHTWWFLSPHCSCPKDENWLVFCNGGEDDRHINEECVLHAK